MNSIETIAKKTDRIEALTDVFGRYFDEQYPRTTQAREDEDFRTERINRESFTRRHTSPARVGRMIGYAISLTDIGAEPDWNNPDFQDELTRKIFPRIKDRTNNRVVATIAFAKALTQK